MDLQDLGKNILECLAVQGKIKSLENKITQGNAKIAKSEEDERKRLEEVKATNVVAQKEIASLGKELTDLRQDLQVRLAELKKDGVDIDLKKSASGKISL